MNNLEYNQQNYVAYGPLLETGELTAGLDYYKPTMSQVHYEQHADTEVTFTFKNRRSEQLLTEYVDPTVLQERLNLLQDRGFTDNELTYFGGLTHPDGTAVFTEDFINYLGANRLPDITVTTDPEPNDLAIETTGPAPLVTFWETVVMSEVNEAYFEGYIRANNIDIMDVYNEGERRLDEKIATLQANPDIKFSDFGTRRHFSYRWHKHVVERLAAERPENFSGTSNVALAREQDLLPIGTFAHEMPMVYAGIADALGKDIRASHGEFLQDWRAKYGENLSVALTDTFGTDFFFTDFTLEQAEEWKSLRHDSGDPIEFGEKVIKFYEERGIDPTTKTIVFSDGLDIDTIVKLHNHFKDRIGNVFGWGTTLTNDLGMPALNIVMKATHVRTPEGLEADTVKLSDNEGKHTGPEPKVQEYQQVFNADEPIEQIHIGRTAIGQLR